MRPHNRPLLLILTLLLASASACSSARLPEQRVEAKTAEAQAPQSSTVVAAIVKANKANLREYPTHSARVVGTVSRGDLLSLLDPTSTGPWYRIRDSKTGADGWIHGNTIAHRTSTNDRNERCQHDRGLDTAHCLCLNRTNANRNTADKLDPRYQQLNRNGSQILRKRRRYSRSVTHIQR